MKKLLFTFACILFSFLCIGQGVSYLGAPTTTVVNRGALVADSIFKIPIRDTLFPIWVNNSYKSGVFIQRPQDSIVYTFNGARWVRLTPTATASSSTSTLDTIVLSSTGVKIFQNVRSSQLLTGTNAEQRNVFVGWQAGNDFLSGTQGYANTAVGWRSLWQARSNVASEASSNTAVGYNSLDSLTTGSFNTGVGVLAGNAISTAQMNTYVGYHSALYQTGERNVGIGTQVLGFQRGTSSDLVAVGYRSQYYSTTGTGNTSVGTSALAGNQTGSRNTIIGNGSASIIANVSDNTAVGFSTQTNTTTTRNTSVGTFSLPANTSNGFNVAVGYDAMKLNASAGQATFVGYAAGDQATSGASFSVGIGDRALRAATGNSNIGIGSLAGSSTTTGASNILIGTNTQTSAVGASNELNIANGIYGVNNYTASTFRLGIGASPVASAKLDVTSTTQGFLPPRMTTTQKNAIASPAAGLLVYDLTLNQMSYYNGSAWVNF